MLFNFILYKTHLLFRPEILRLTMVTIPFPNTIPKQDETPDPVELSSRISGVTVRNLSYT